jgi:hypothetical protein
MGAKRFLARKNKMDSIAAALHHADVDKARAEESGTVRGIVNEEG